jgi:hypothetical protein
MAKLDASCHPLSFGLVRCCCSFTVHVNHETIEKLLLLMMMMMIEIGYKRRSSTERGNQCAEWRRRDCDLTGLIIDFYSRSLLLLRLIWIAAVLMIMGGAAINCAHKWRECPGVFLTLSTRCFLTHTHTRTLN